MSTICNSSFIIKNLMLISQFSSIICSTYRFLFSISFLMLAVWLLSCLPLKSFIFYVFFSLSPFTRSTSSHNFLLVISAFLTYYHICLFLDSLSPLFLFSTQTSDAFIIFQTINYRNTSSRAVSFLNKPIVFAPISKDPLISIFIFLLARIFDKDEK